MPEINVIDIVACVFILLSMLHGYKRGLSGEVAQLVGVLVGFCLGMAGYRPFAAWMAANTRVSGGVADVLAFIVILVFSTGALVLVRVVLSRVMRVVFDESLNKGGGVIAAFIRSGVVTLIMFIVMNLVPHPYLNEQFGQASLIGRGTLRILPVLRAEIERRANAAERAEGAGAMPDAESHESR